MLDVLALLAAAAAVLLALLLAGGLTEAAHAGRRIFSVFAAVLLVSSVATVGGVYRALDEGSTAWLVVSIVPPLTLLALLVYDRSVLWGNFPPPAPQRALERFGVLAILALPGILGFIAA